MKMTLDEVEKLLKTHDIPIETFTKWINHQTCPIEGYYSWDVEKFVYSQITGN